jgi:hypothetical protein
MRKKAFKLNKITKLSDMAVGDHFSESDLALQDAGQVYQFKYLPRGGRSKYVIKPGIHQLASTQQGLTLKSLDFSKKRLLMDMVNTKAIIDEANSFFSKLEVYKELEVTAKRGILLYSAPGFGKSSTLSVFSEQARELDPGTVVIVWPTGKIDADDFQEFLATDSKYAASCTKLVLIMEDIGGGNTDSEGPKAVDAGLLNMLDGVSEVFKLPTLIVATTNTPERLLESLSNRPGRFDVMLELKPPTAEERLKLFEFIAKRSATEEESKAIKSDKADGFSAAHMTEIVVRHRIKDQPVWKVVEDIADHTKKAKNSFHKQSNKMGFIDDDE